MIYQFIRSDLEQLKAYIPHPGGEVSIPVDHLDTNESPYDLPQPLKEKLGDLYAQEILTNRYPNGSHEELKSAIAEYITESANLENAIAPEQVSMGNGSDELIRSLLIATCLKGEGSILVANPTFSMYGILAQTLGIQVHTVTRNKQFEINLDQANSTLQQTQNPPIRVVFVVHPNSPTANPLSDAEIDWLRSLPENILAVIDEAYFEFSQTSLVGELNEHPNWVILRTFSKAFRLAALRVGYAIASPTLIQTLEKIRLPYNLPSFSQLAAKLALDNRHLLLSSITETLQERDKLYQALSQLSPLKVYPSGANFLYVRLQNSQATPNDYQTLQKTLKQQGTLIRYTGGGFRITVGTPEENKRTVERMKNLNLS